MRDIGSRILRYRLSRYARPEDLWRHRMMRWLIPALLLWVLYAGVLSEHSWLRLWRLGHEKRAVAARLEATRGEIDRLERQLDDPAQRRELQERVLRERNGFARPGEIVYRVEGADSLR